MTTIRTTTTDLDLDFIDEAVRRIGSTPDRTIPLLQAIQDRYRWVPPAALERLAERTDITPERLEGVATFYAQFRHEPAGEHFVRICHGTACHVKGAQPVTEALCRELGIEGDSGTDPKRLFTVEKVACLGCCTLAPVMQIDGITYGHLEPSTVHDSIDDFLELKRRGLLNRFPQPGAPPHQALGEVRVCLDSCCCAGGSADLFDALDTAIRRHRLPVTMRRVGCVLMCHEVPMVDVVPTGGGEPVRYARVNPEDAEGILLKHFRPGGALRRFFVSAANRIDSLLTDDVWRPVTRYALDLREGPAHAFLAPQRPLALEGYGRYEPLDLASYREHGGFEALSRALNSMSPQEIVETIDRSGLRGRGGAGFPTGRKWSLVREAPGEGKTIVCNGDEGDPGAFMDRMLLESYPLRVIEGILIAAVAVGAHEGIVYVRHEYPLAVRQLTEAIRTLEAEGILGESVMGSGFAFALSVVQGAGAFVCGEETALIASIEGRRGMPRLRPPYPNESGLRGRPTLVNNVETFAMTPWIVRNGAEAFSALGTEASPGTKVFALAGKVRRGGLIEVPMGVTIRQIVDEIGGGIANDRPLKAVQVGGPSGGCIPGSLADTPIDFESLDAAGAIMGSGGLVVFDDADCMVDIARYFLAFTQQESCGRCTPCRIGTRRMLDILDRLCTGAGRREDIDELERLGRDIARASLCGLGRTAPNPVLSTLRHFRPEYEAHLDGRCPAGSCGALVRYRIADDCIGCTRCAQACPADAIAPRPYEKHEIDDEACTRCDTCRGVCPVNAIRIVTGDNDEPTDPCRT